MAIDAISVASAAAVAGPIGAAIGLTAIAAKSYIERHVFAREHKRDDMMREQLRNHQHQVDQKVKINDFVPLYLRARDTAAKSEREHKLESFHRHAGFSADDQRTADEYRRQA